MLDYKIVNYKSTITNNGETYVDLMSKSFDKDVEITGQICVVNQYYVGRPDLISMVYYHDDRYADIICKVNGISNPFELNEDDVLLIPDLECVQQAMKNFDVPSELISTDNDTLSETDKKYRKMKNEPRSPNQQVVGESNYVIDKSLGVVFY